MLICVNHVCINYGLFGDVLNWIGGVWWFCNGRTYFCLRYRDDGRHPNNRHHPDNGYTVMHVKDLTGVIKRVECVTNKWRDDRQDVISLMTIMIWQWTALVQAMMFDVRNWFFVLILILMLYCCCLAVLNALSNLINVLQMWLIVWTIDLWYLILCINEYYVKLWIYVQCMNIYGENASLILSELLYMLVDEFNKWVVWSGNCNTLLPDSTF